MRKRSVSKPRSLVGAALPLSAALFVTLPCAAQQQEAAIEAAAAPEEQKAPALSPPAASESAKEESTAESEQPPAEDEVRHSPAHVKRAEHVQRAVHIDRFAESSFANDTESRTRSLQFQQRLIADRFEEVLAGFVGMEGYFRAGYGRSDAGGAQTHFQAPGAISKYRLGNEDENYGELILSKNIYLPGVFHVDTGLRPDGTPKGPIARVQLRLNFYNAYENLNSSADTSVGLPEAWASIGNVIAAQPHAKIWAGNRFFRRHDIHIIDFFFWDMSGGGGGIEDIEIGPAKLAFSWIGAASTSGLSYVPRPDPTNKAGFSKSNYELRIYDLPVLSGELELGLTYAQARSGIDELGNQGPSSEGFAINMVHTTPRFLSEDGTNKFSVQYGLGAAKTFTAGFETVTLSNGIYIRPDPMGTWRVRVTEHFTSTLSHHFSLGPVLIFQATEHGEDGGREYWVSGGLRPIAHINHYFSVAMEGGMDWVHNLQAKTSGALYKLTLAPQVSVGDHFNSRPSVRVFATYANWTDDFKGQVGGVDYRDRNDGVTWGMQMESWW